MTITPSTNDQLMVVAAHRYCLGRSTYATHACAEWLQEHWSQLAGGTRNVILRETKEALERGEAGMDVREWERFVEWAEKGGES